jgi:hypothetical protein
MRLRSAPGNSWSQRFPIRTSLRAFMALVLAISVGVAALLLSSPLSASITLTLTLAVLGFASLAVSYRKGRRRAWWLGFAVFGWGYLALAFGPFAVFVYSRLATSLMLTALHRQLSPPAPPYPLVSPPVAPVEYIDAAINLKKRGDLGSAAQYCKAAFTYRHLLTADDRKRLTEISDLLDPGEKAGLLAEGTPDPATAPHTTRFTLGVGTREDFCDVGHCLFALLSGCLGGILAHYLLITRDSPSISITGGYAKPESYSRAG